MAAKKQEFSLDAVRTDGWFERIGEGIGSFQALCEIVGERFFAPGWTDYRKRVYYQAYDVTGLVRPGDASASPHGPGQR